MNENKDRDFSEFAVNFAGRFISATVDSVSQAPGTADPSSLGRIGLSRLDRPPRRI